MPYSNRALRVLCVMLLLPAAVRAQRPTPRTCIAAAGSVRLVVTADGNLWAWGRNKFGGLGVAGTADEEGGSDHPLLVPGVTGVRSVALGSTHSLALLRDGSVMAWGDGEDGQLGDDEARWHMKPSRVEGLPPAIAIAAGTSLSLALLPDGTVRGWGQGTVGRLGDGTLFPNGSSVAIRRHPVQVKELANIVAITTNGEVSLAVRKDGTLWAWGEKRLGLGEPSPVPVQVPGITNALSVAIGSEHALVLLTNGTVMTWGANDFGQTGEDARKGNATVVPPNATTMRAVALPGKAVAIVAAHRRSFAILEDGTLLGWGDTSLGALGTRAVVQGRPVAIPELRNALAVSSGNYVSIGAASDGTIYTWGSGLAQKVQRAPAKVAGVGAVAPDCAMRVR